MCNPDDFIFKNIAIQLTKKFPKAKKGSIASAARQGQKLFSSQGNFKKGKVFDECYKAAEKHLKTLINAKM